MHRYAWRYVGMYEAFGAIKALGTATLFLLLTRFAAGLALSWTGYAHYALVPIGVVIIDFGLAVSGIMGIRIIRRQQSERRDTKESQRSVQGIRTMLVGAGKGGLMVVREALARPDLGILPIGFLDDNPDKHGTALHGVQVLGDTQRLAELCTRHEAEQVLVTIAHATGDAVRRVVEACEAVSLPTKIIPGLHEIVSGELNLVRIRDVAIDDLLRRDVVELDLAGIASLIQNKCVLVTGAGGSIGSELARQIARFQPKLLVLLERFESALFTNSPRIGHQAPRDRD